ncbi:headcase protein-like [Mytilus trossulus]|uniref:headcase protein-like n=1 Tax=Mytilus trossulus TaxID=6551 RepID=UPI003004889B
MPHRKHQKVQLQNVVKKDVENNNVQAAAETRAPVVEVNDNRAGPKLVKCCVPLTCTSPEDLINPKEPEKSVKVFCNNEACDFSKWMHKDCFEEWEETVLSYLRSCGRARSWSEKQRLQNLWTKKGYDLAFKACDCKCGRGHIRKDLDYFPKPQVAVVDNKNKKKPKKKNDKPAPVVSNGKGGHASTSIPHNNNHIHSAPINTTNVNNNNNNTSYNNHHVSNTNHIFSTQRSRTDSVSSSGSLPRSSGSIGSSSSPTPSSPIVNGNMNPPAFPKSPKTIDVHSFNANTSFRRRQDLSAFTFLPRHKQNPYHIKMDDDGTDDTRNFILSHLTSYKVCSLSCVICKSGLPVFDRYPMIDGTFFLSPQAYGDGVVQVISDGRLQFINAVCVQCLEKGSDIRCASCKCPWDGSALQLGTMYTYDIFAATPCCQKRLTCKQCRRAVVDVNTGLTFYSQYSRMIACPYCKAYDFHFIRPLNEAFNVRAKQSIWN